MRISSAIALVGIAATTLMAGVRAESDVLDLTAKNFAASVGDEKIMLVEFFAPWCGHCKALAPEYEIAATQLKEHGIPIAKVDCTVETDLCQEQGVQGYPTLKVFREGTPSDYQGARKADAIVSYLKKQNLPPVSNLTAETLEAFSKSDKVVIVGVLPKDDERREELERIAKVYRDDYVFGVIESSDEVASGSGVILYKQFDEGKNVLDGAFDAESLVEFIKENSVPTMDEIGPNNYARYMDSGLPLAYFFFATPEQKTQYSAEIEAVAKSFKGKMNFAYIDASKFGAHAANINLKEQWPAFGVQNVVTGAKFPLDQEGELTIERMQKLADDVLAGTVEPSVKSEAAPESNDGPVKVVVATTYAEIVENNKDKDVLIEFYAPWCGHCKNLAPIYEELGEAYKGSNIVIAKLDATANDLPSSVPFGIQGFPTIKFRKAGAAVDEYIDYNGNRSKEDFIEFLNENATDKFEVKVSEDKPVVAEDIEHDELSSTQIVPQAHYNVVFDIDGVLIKGRQVLPQTHRALGLLQSNNVPYIFLTNGGGLKEADKAEQLSRKIGVHISPKQLILSHSPMRELAQKYEDSNVLIVGGNGSECRHVAEHYGFKHVVTPEEVHAVFPSKYLQNVRRPVDAIMVFHDSVDWGRDLQVIIDALTSQDGYLNTTKTQKELHTTPQTVPLYFSNSDLVWSNEFPTPRFAQGTFRTCLERIFEDKTGHKLQYTLYGKPMTTTYQYAEAVLNRIAPIHLGPDGMPKRRTVYG
ncbi:protein disulfide-isomerase precursor [Linnemannia hyalina]|uniref:Protein disulfide-isomerase n=1 Tax=Linnemannia hyalina TaxID=64524 RepID=A0A9P8BRE2_9FUNG|nr:protein disulfide-isomerase precursor [Linnemannia hyalina]